MSGVDFRLKWSLRSNSLSGVVWRDGAGAWENAAEAGTQSTVVW